MRLRPWLGVLGVLAIATMASPRPLGVSATTDDWALFHHDSAHLGVSPDTTIGAAHAPSLVQKWSASIGGGASVESPVVAFNSTVGDDVVYSVSTGGTVHAFKASNGSSVWSASIGGGVASPALDTANNTLYVGDDAGTMTAFNAATGSVECTLQLPVVAPETTPGRIQEAPTIDPAGSGGPILYFADIGQKESENGGRFHAMYGVGNTNTECTQYWMTNLANTGNKVNGSWSPPALGTDRNGRELVVFGESQPTDRVVALDAHTGAKVWSFNTLKNFSDADVGAGPTIISAAKGSSDGAVYIDGKDRIEYGLDLTTGGQLWSFNMGANAMKSPNSVSCAAVVGGNVVVAFAKYVYAFNPTTGALVWRSAAMGGNVLASVAVSGGPGDQVVLINDISGHLYAFQPSNGATLLNKTVDAGHAFDASPAVADAMVFLAGTDGKVYAFG